MKKVIAFTLFGLLLFSARHVVKPAAKSLKKAAHVAYRLAV